MTDDVKKMLGEDKIRLINRAARKKFGEDSPWFYNLDEDKSEAYGDVYTEGEGYMDVKVSYTLSGTSVEITSDPIEVIKQSEYVEISKAQEDGIVAKLMTALTSHFGGTSKEAPPVETVPFIKQFNDEQMIAIEPLYIAPDEVDGHGWTADADVLREMTESCNKAIQEGRLLSKYNHAEETDDFYFVKAWINECDCYIGNHYVPEGQPMIKTQFTNEEAWKKRKSGELCGVSIGAKGIWEEIND